MKAYIQELTQKTERYKECKAELQGTRNEISVLMRTEAILRSRDENIKEVSFNGDFSCFITGSNLA